MAETSSTQDVAKDLVQEGVSPLAEMSGFVVTAGRQTGGRGRLGRAWADTGDDGIAVTFVTPDADSERLALASAVATARTSEAFLDRAIGIKWPNDIVVDGRKIAGILIERAKDAAFIGIGVNVTQTSFDGPLANTAASLWMLGAVADRCAVLMRLIREIDIALSEDLNALANDYAARDALRGRIVTFGTPAGHVTGVVEYANPKWGLAIECDGVRRELVPATSTVLSWGDAAR